MDRNSMWPDALLRAFQLDAAKCGCVFDAVADRDPFDRGGDVIRFAVKCVRCGDAFTHEVLDPMQAEAVRQSAVDTIGWAESHHAEHALADGKISRAQLLVELGRALRGSFPEHRAEALIKALEARLIEHPIADLAARAIKCVAAAHDEADIWDPDVEDFHAKFTEAVARRLREST